MRQRKEILNKIAIYGNQKEIEIAETAINSIKDIATLPESKARLEIQKVIDEQSLKADILFDGNTVWSKKRIMVNLEKIMQAGVLYDKRPCTQRDTTESGQPIRVKHTQSENPKYAQIGHCLIIPMEFHCILSDYFYEFLHLECGSIAHYGKCGWVTEYPTVEDLKKFFKCNEWGRSVLQYTLDYSSEKTDRIEIIKAIEKRFYPFKAYVAAKQKTKTELAAKVQMKNKGG